MNVLHLCPAKRPIGKRCCRVCDTHLEPHAPGCPAGTE